MLGEFLHSHLYGWSYTNQIHREYLSYGGTNPERIVATSATGNSAGITYFQAPDIELHMCPPVVAGVDWAGAGWLAVYFENGSYDGYTVQPTFEALWEDRGTPAVALVDVPIGLPEDEDSLTDREHLDSLARSVTERSSSVFPVPSRDACAIAYEDDASYEKVVEQNEADLDKGLSWQSYYIAEGVGEIDAYLRQNDATEWIIEAHPEVCFRALLDRPLEYSKNSAAGFGERLTALETLDDNPEETVKQIAFELRGESSDIGIDDVLDAVALGTTASKGKDALQYLPENPEFDPCDIPIQMAYWGEYSLVE